MVEYVLGTPAPGAFAYSVEQPTYYTELLSHTILDILNGLSAAGGRLYIEDIQAYDKEADFDGWLSDFRTWLKDTVSNVTAWLSEPEESRALLPILAAPALPATIGTATVLSAGLSIKLVTSIVSDVSEVVNAYIAARRASELPRLLDKAFFDDSFWGGRYSKIDRLIDEIGRAGLSSVPAESVKSSLEVIADVLQNQERVIKLLSHVVVSSGGKIDSQEFCFPQDVGIVAG